MKKAFLFGIIIFIFACSSKKQMNGTYRKVSANPTNNIISLLFYTRDFSMDKKKKEIMNLCDMNYKGKIEADCWGVSDDNKTLTISTKNLYAHSEERYHDLKFKIIDENTIQCTNKEYPNLYLEVYKKDLTSR